jgi:hypothetical protein
MRPGFCLRAARDGRTGSGKSGGTKGVPGELDGLSHSLSLSYWQGKEHRRAEPCRFVYRTTRSCGYKG